MNLSDDVIISLRNVIVSRCGLYFKDHDLKDLEKTVLHRIKTLKLSSPGAYYHLLTLSEDRESEFRELLNLLTVNHTYFFRNEPQFTALRDKILPELMARRLEDHRLQADPSNKPVLRIWSAGCSSGEEPYSIAMTLQDVIVHFEDWDIQIIATDVSTHAMERARKGQYSESSMRSVDQDHRDRYFVENKGIGGPSRFDISVSIKKMVHIDYFNLMEDEFLKGFDVIFCRNVVIYFEIETTVKIMNKFHSSLAQDGYLFIGYSESLQFITEKFKMQDWSEAIYYIRAPKEVLEKGAKLRPVLSEVENFLEKEARAELLADEKELKIESVPLPPRKIEDLLIEIIKSLHLKQYNKALGLIEEAHQIAPLALDPYYLAAEAYANQGNFRQAEERLKTALKMNTLFAPAHHLLGYIAMEKDLLEEAKVNLKKALYLDKDFSLAHFNLAHLYRKEGKIHDAIREYRNTLKVLAQFPLTDIIAYSGGFNAATLISVCKDNIERLKLAFTE